MDARLILVNSPVGACRPATVSASSVFRPVARGGASGTVAGGGRGAWLGSSQRLLLPADPVAGEAYGFSVDTHWHDLPENSREAVLYGSGKDVVTFSYSPMPAARTQRKHRFEGILPNLERRYREDRVVRGTRGAGQIHRERPCPDCSGARLNVRRATSSSPIADAAAIVVLPIGRDPEILRDLTLPGGAARSRSRSSRKSATA